MAWLEFSTLATFAHFCLSAHFASAQHHPRITGRDAATTITRSTEPSISGPVTSSFSRITGPNIAIDSYTWSQYIIPVTVGTVLFVVNKASNKTTSTTIYHTDYVTNGSTALLTRTDTNNAGTVTQVKTAFGQNQSITVAYPTNYFVPAPSLTWTAALPTVVNNATCCFDLPTLSATPTHPPFVQIGPLNEEDPRGWLYTLIGFKGGDAHSVFNSTQVTSLFAGQRLSIGYDGCPHTYCPLEIASVSPAEGVQARPGGILATSTTTIDIPDWDEITSAKPTATVTAVQDQEPNTYPEITTPEDTPTPSTPNPGPSPTAQPQATYNPYPAGLTTQPETTKVSGAPPQSVKGTAEPPQISNTGEKPGAETTKPNPPQETVTSQPDTGLVITIGSSSVTANSASQFIIEGQTLTPGSSITVGSGSSTTVIALQTTGTETVLVVGGSSSTLSAASGGLQSVDATRTTGIGGIVCSMFGCETTKTTNAGLTGSAAPTSSKPSKSSILQPSGGLFLGLFGLFCAALI